MRNRQWFGDFRLVWVLIRLEWRLGLKRQWLYNNWTRLAIFSCLSWSFDLKCMLAICTRIFLLLVPQSCARCLILVILNLAADAVLRDQLFIALGNSPEWLLTLSSSNFSIHFWLCSRSTGVKDSWLVSILVHGLLVKARNGFDIVLASRRRSYRRRLFLVFDAFAIWRFLVSCNLFYFVFWGAVNFLSVSKIFDCVTVDMTHSLFDWLDRLELEACTAGHDLVLFTFDLDHVLDFVLGLVYLNHAF